MDSKLVHKQISFLCAWIPRTMPRTTLSALTLSPVLPSKGQYPECIQWIHHRLRTPERYRFAEAWISATSVISSVYYAKITDTLSCTCRGTKEILDDCRDPFENRFDNHCLSADQQLQVISSSKCAASWAKLYKIDGDKQTFKDIATVSKQLHGECGKIESEVHRQNLAHLALLADIACCN